MAIFSSIISTPQSNQQSKERPSFNLQPSVQSINEKTKHGNGRICHLLFVELHGGLFGFHFTSSLARLLLSRPKQNKSRHSRHNTFTNYWCLQIPAKNSRGFPTRA